MLAQAVAGLLSAGHRQSAANVGNIARALSALSCVDTTIRDLISHGVSCKRHFAFRADCGPYGQPVHATHPELLAPHELTPGIPAAEYAARRSRLAAALPPGALAVVPAAATAYMAGVIPWPYRQDPDLYYLTGLTQHAVALLRAPGEGEGSSRPTFTLFIDPPNASREVWEGATISREAAAEVFGADEVYYTSELPRRLPGLAAPAPCLFYDTDRTPTAHLGPTIAAALKAALSSPRAPPFASSPSPSSPSSPSPPPPTLRPLRPLLHGLRATKSRAEAALLRASAAMSAASLAACMAATAPGVTEYGLAAAFEYGVKAAGAQRLAYPSVVAGGPDAVTIHYGRNDKVLAAGQLVLVDAGCEAAGYVSDVSRTWPVGGRFSGPQRDVYEVVLEAHRRCLAAVRPGASLRSLHALACEVLAEGVHALRLLPGASLAEIRAGGYRRFFPHALGHHLGLDTHDCALWGHERALGPGAVLTVEPGLYIPDEPRYGPLAGIGVRIEDDVLVTEAGCEVLSHQAPTSVADVEALAGSARRGGGGLPGGLPGPAGPMPLPPLHPQPLHRAPAPRAERGAAAAEAGTGPTDGAGGAAAAGGA